MEIFNIVIANLESNTELFYESYKQSLSHHDISIRNDFYPINSIENLEINKVIENINKLDNYKDNNFSLLDYFVGHLKLNIQDKSPELFKKLDTWLDTYQLDGLINIINQPTVKPENNQPCLLVDMETLKEILKVSGLASSYKRDNLLSKIKLDKNFSGKNIDNYTDEDFAETLINFLENTKQIEILINLCQQLESIIKTGPYHTKLQTIKSKIF